MARAVATAREMALIMGVDLNDRGQPRQTQQWSGAAAQEELQHAP